MKPQLLPNGNLLIPRRAEGDGVLGDGMEEIDPGHPEFEDWMADLEKEGTG